MKDFKKYIGICLTFLCVVTAEAEQLYYCSFAKGGWNPDEWILVKSARWDYFGGWIQKDTHIENETPENAKPNELLQKYASETYTSMVLKRKVSGNVTVISTMEFDDRMAPLIVMAPELGKDKLGRSEYREHFEIVFSYRGINVWHHFYIDGKPWWKNAAYFRFTLEPRKKYALTVKIEKTNKGKQLSVLIDGHEMGYMDDSLPDEFYVGITGCEGVNRFYDFSISTEE